MTFSFLPEGSSDVFWRFVASHLSEGEINLALPQIAVAPRPATDGLYGTVCACFLVVSLEGDLVWILKQVVIWFGVHCIAVLAAPAWAQEPNQSMPTVEEMEATYAEMFAAAVAHADRDDVDPMELMQTWGTLLTTKVVLEARRSMDAGDDRPDMQKVQETVLARWETLRPGHQGPAVLRTTLEISDPSLRAESLLTLLGRFPGSQLITWNAAQNLRTAGEHERARQLLEANANQNPDSPTALRYLVEHYRHDDNSEMAPALEAWAALVPGDARIATYWFAARLDQQQPERTEELLDRLFENAPESIHAARFCAQLARGKGLYRSQGRDCIERLAESAEVSEEVRKHAGETRARLALADGDAGLLGDHLDSLNPEEQIQALTHAAVSLEAPGRCADRIALLRRAVLSSADRPKTFNSIASAASACRGRPAAQALFLELLGLAPDNYVAYVVQSWVSKVNGEYTGAVPTETAAMLETRLQNDPKLERVYPALYSVYQVQKEPDRSFDLLRRWQDHAPNSMRSEHRLALVWGLVAEDEVAAGFRVLEERLRLSFSAEEAEAMWNLLAVSELDASDGGPDDWEAALVQAEAFARDLTQSDDLNRSSFGHLLVARGARARGDISLSERHYGTALATATYPRKEWALELLSLVASSEDAADPLSRDQRLASRARELCSSTELKNQLRGVEACSRKLLVESGEPKAVLLLADSGRELSPRKLASLAAEAQAAGDTALAQKLRRQALEADPNNVDHWTGLGNLLQEEGLHDELEVLFEDARAKLASLPIFLLQAVGRSRTERGMGQEAVDVLREAREALPEGHDPAWLDYELRRANAVLGRQLSISKQMAARSFEKPVQALGVSDAGGVVRPPADLPEDALASDLLIAGEALRSGRRGRYDPAAGEALIARAAAKGSAKGAYRLALVTADAQHVSQDQKEEVERLASQGDSFAQYLWGTAALTGVAHPQDFRVARQWLQSAAAQDEPWAHHNLAYMQEMAQGYPQPDIEAARDGYLRASELGNVPSLHSFARVILDHYPFSEMCAPALQKLERGARLGHPASVSLLGKQLLYGHQNCIEADALAAIPWLEAVQSNGNPGPSFDLGIALLDAGDPADGPRALALIERLSSEPNVLSLETLAFLYGSGVGGRDVGASGRNLAGAVLLGSDGWMSLRQQAQYPPFQRILGSGMRNLERLTAADDPDATAMLADMLLNGPYFAGEVGVRDPERGALLARRAAESGDPVAMRVLASCLEHGNGVLKDPNEALLWTTRASEAGDSLSMYRRALALLQGKYIELDVREGMAWLEEAAALGQWQAMGELANVYAEGRYGIPPDLARAEPWKRKRAALNDSEARGWLQLNGFPPEQ